MRRIDTKNTGSLETVIPPEWTMEELRKLVIRIMISLEEKYYGKKARDLARYSLQRDPTHQKVFDKVIFYSFHLIKEKESTRNFKAVLRDYLISIYERAQHWNSLLNPLQISPSPTNRLAFESWIIEWEDANSSEYWTREEQSTDMEITQGDDGESWMKEILEVE